MLRLDLSSVNKVSFYTPENLGLSVGDEVVLVFTQDYSQNESAVESTIINSYNKYLIFDISGSDLPQVGGLYTVNLAIEPVWNTYDVLWEEADVLWEDILSGNSLDYERAFIYEFVQFTPFSSSIESASYTQAPTSTNGYVVENYINDYFEFGYAPYLSSVETSSYTQFYGGGINVYVVENYIANYFEIPSASQFISANENAYYYVYNN